MARLVGDFFTSRQFPTKFRIAYFASSWVPDALVRFGTLYFVVTSDEGLEQVCAATALTPTIDDVKELFRNLWMPSSEAHASP